MSNLKTDQINIFWFRRDLRLNDNTGLYYALKEGLPVLPLFIFDTEILSGLKDNQDPRVTFIHNEITRIHKELRKHHSGLLVRTGSPVEIFKSLRKEYNIKTVYVNRDYEPFARKRDDTIRKFLKKEGTTFHDYKDQVIFDKDEILNNEGEPYKVFTPYSKSWMDRFDIKKLKRFDSASILNNCITPGPDKIPPLADTGFKRADISFPDRELDIKKIRDYDKHRDEPWKDGTTRLGIHFRHGTVSIRKAVETGYKQNETWLNELIWREFYMMILYHFPGVVNQSFKPRYDHIEWENKQEHFDRWKEGRTGYPLVDAGMRQLNKTGFMHNRTRMVVASFLTKHLLIDWRWGEAYFAEKLLDYELSSNNGGWQWAAGTGTDAQPYFRIFNPHEQAKKYDPENKYIRKWIEEFDSDNYPEPIIDHNFARERALKRYKKAI